MAKKKKTKSAKTNALREKKNKSIVLLLKEIQANPALGKVPLDKAMQIVFEAAISRIMPLQKTYKKMLNFYVSFLL